MYEISFRFLLHSQKLIHHCFVPILVFMVDFSLYYIGMWKEMREKKVCAHARVMFISKLGSILHNNESLFIFYDWPDRTTKKQNKKKQNMKKWIERETKQNWKRSNSNFVCICIPWRDALPKRPIVICCLAIPIRLLKERRKTHTFFKRLTIFFSFGCSSMLRFPRTILIVLIYIIWPAVNRENEKNKVCPLFYVPFQILFIFFLFCFALVCIAQPPKT